MSDIQKDLVLAPNEYAFILDQTKGNIACNVGPHKMSLSQSDILVTFDKKTKKFIPCCSFEEAIQTFVSVPEGWYVSLKNPVIGDKEHPMAGISNNIPDNIQVGHKINIKGPANFALYPGQIAEIIQGHSLCSNQYLVAQVYDAETLNNNSNIAKETKPYVNGQNLIIKGTKTSFYIPPTGIEVKQIGDKYVRQAVTLERLEYCILKNEDGKRRYVYGPEVVFLTPTETFIQDDNGEIKRKAIELSDISGVYVKVIADYKDKNEKEHKVGEELFITGKD